MKFPLKFPPLQTVRFAPFAIIFFFLLTNFTGIFFTRAFAPSVDARSLADAIPRDIPTSGDSDLDLIIFKAGGSEGVDPRFIHAVIWQESKYDPNARSHAGAQGVMQLMPATAKRFGCTDPYDVEENVAAGTKYLSWLLKRFNGDVTLALAGYNAGEGAVDKFKGVPPYNETRNYVRVIAARYGKTYHPVLSPEDAKFVFRLFPQVEPMPSED